MERYRGITYDLDEKQILARINAEIRAADPIADRCHLVSFTSRSAGRGRQRSPREVVLLVIDGYAYQVVKDEVKGGGHRMRPDTLAMEILEDLPPEQRSVENLLGRAIKLSQNNY